MAILGEVKGGIDLLTRGWDWFQDRRDPVRAQAKRLIDAFEAHGIARQQIARVLPPPLAMPPVKMSSPSKLKESLSPALLDWAAEYLALNRAWLDGVDDQPHELVDGYKNTDVYDKWLRRRQATAQAVNRCLYVWTADTGPLGFDSRGPLCLVYAEDSDGLDGKEFSRYWLLSREWRLGHPPCVENMLEVVTIARALGIMSIGRIVPMKWLMKLESGKAFAPQVREHLSTLWHPEDAVFGSPVVPRRS